MYTVGHTSERLSTAPAPTFLERLSWVDKLPLTLISGVLLGLSSSGFGIWWLAWFALSPLLILVFGARGKVEAALTGLLFGLAYNLASLRWLYDVYPLRWFGLDNFVGMVAAAQLWFLESLHQSILLSMLALFIYLLPLRSGYLPDYKRPFWPLLLSVPLMYVFMQWVIAPAEFFLGLPINQLAYSQSRMPELIQIARLGGSMTIDFLLVMVNCAVACLIIEVTAIARQPATRTDPLSPRSGAVVDFLIACAVVALCATWGQSEIARAAVMPAYFDGPAMEGAADSKNADRTAAKPVAAPLTAQQKANFAPPITIAVIQGNLQIDNRASMSAESLAQRFSQLASKVGASIIVVPEAAVGGGGLSPLPVRAVFEQIAVAEKKEVVLGSIESVRDGRINAVRLIGPEPGKNRLYIKQRLVPFTEFIPLGPLGAVIPSNLKTKLTNTTGGFVEGKSASIIDSSFGKIGASVGSEIVYQDAIAAQVSKGASLLINVSDTSYFHNSTLGQQFLSAAILRAVENGRYLILASNTGVSSVIDPYGIVTSASLQGHKGILVDRVQFLHKKTPFTRAWWMWTPFYYVIRSR